MITFEPDEFLNEELDSLASVGDTFGIKAMDSHNREYYLKNIPFSEKDLKESDEAISAAFYNLGLIYSEGLNNYEKSIEAFEFSLMGLWVLIREGLDFIQVFILAL